MCVKWVAITSFKKMGIRPWLKAVCEPCCRLRDKAYRKKNPHRVSQWHRKASLKALYNITEEQYAIMLKNQGGVCAICKGLNENGKELAVDHKENPFRVRGLLCMNCNLSLGTMKDDPARLRAAADYLDMQRTDIYEFQVEGAAQ